MVQTVKLSNGDTASFPDDFDHEKISSILKKHFSGEKKSPESQKSSNGLVDKLRGSSWGQAGLGVADELQNLATSLPDLLGQQKGLGDSDLPDKFSQMSPPFAKGMDFKEAKRGEGLAYEGGKLGAALASLFGGGAALRGAKSVRAMNGPVRRAAETGGFGALENREDRLAGGATGAGISALIDAIPFVGKGINKLKPSNLFRGSLTPEQLAKNLDITKGTTTGLGDVLESPFLKRTFENSLPKIAGSGTDNAMLETANQVHQKGKDILGKFLGKNSPENVEQQLNENLQKVYKQQDVAKKKLYDEVDKIAHSSKVEVPLDSFGKQAREYKELINDSGFLKLDPQNRKVFSKLFGDVKIDPGSGSPIIGNISVKEANLLKGKLNQTASELKAKPETRGQGKVFAKLASSLKSDIGKSIDSSGNHELKSAYKSAEENYKKNFAPFLDKDIFKFSSGAGDSDLITQAFIKGGSNDRANLAAKLAEKLPKSAKGLLPYSYLSRALDEEGNLSPSKLRTLYKSLGKKQREALIPDKELRKELSDYTKLVGMNTEPLSIMANPKTGQRNLDMIPALLNGTGGAIGGVSGYESGGLPGALAGFLGGSVLPGAVGKYATKKLTSPEYREKLVKKMIENEKKKGKKSDVSLGNILSTYFSKTKE